MNCTILFYVVYMITTRQYNHFTLLFHSLIFLNVMFAAANGVVIATEKKLPSILVDETSVCITESCFFFISLWLHSVAPTPTHRNAKQLHV